MGNKSIDFLNAVLRHMRVNLRGFAALVPKQLLYVLLLKNLPFGTAPPPQLHDHFRRSKVFHRRKLAMPENGCTRLFKMQGLLQKKTPVYKMQFPD